MATAVVSSKSDKIHLKCLICFNDFKNSRCLPCLHSFCEQCLSDYIVSNVKNSSEKITCPVCQERCDPPNRNLSIDKWASSFLLNDIIVSIQEIEEQNEETSKLCDPCRSEGEEVNAQFWCPDCRDKLCARCLRYHKRNRALKNHNTCPIEDMDTNLILNYNQHCSCDRGQSVDMVCVDHKQMCCIVCSTTVHRGCKEVRALDSTAKEFISGNMAANVLKDVKNITDHVQQFQDFRQSTETTFQSDISKCSKDMDDICNAIKQQIDTIQTNFRTSEKEIREKVQSKQSERKEKLLRFLTNVENSKKIFNLFNQHGDPKQKFIAYDTIISQLNSHYNRLKTELEGEHDIRVILEVNKDFQKLTQMATSLCRINTLSILSTGASGFVENMDVILKTMATRTRLNPVMCAAQIARPTVVLFRDVAHVRSVPRKEVTGGKYGSYFTGGTSVPNGHILMTDYYNNRLVEFDLELKMVNQYNVDGRPKDVTSLGNDVYVTVWKDEKHYIFKCRSSGELVIKTTAPDWIWGLAVSDDGTIVVGTQSRIQVLSSSGKPVHIIKKSGFSYVAISCMSRAKFYHSDGAAMMCRSLQDGKQLYTYRHDNMETPVGMCVGDTGFLYVCCNSGKVLQFSSDGQQGRILLESVHGIRRPRAVLYNPIADQLVVTSYDEDMVMAVYKLK